MGEITAVVSDPADSRELVCVLSDSVPVSELAVELAELAGFPLVGPQGEHIGYGLIPKQGALLDPGSSLEKANVAEPLMLRLVPELTIGADQGSLPIPEDSESTEEAGSRVRIVQERGLLDDEGVHLRPEVAISAAAHREIERFAARNRLAECGGLLLGTVQVGKRARSIQIEAIAPALGAVETRTNLTFTLESWRSMLELRDGKYPQLRVLGWFHTHAGWGVFLSEIDLFFHERFFSHPNMVAYVLDPAAGGESFFYRRSGRVVRCPTYSLVGSPSRTRDRRVGAGRRRAIMAAIGTAAAAAAVLYASLAPSRVDRTKPLPESAVRRTAPARASHGEPPSSYERDSSATASTPGVPGSADYVMQHGDTLWDVCRRVYEDGTLGDALGRYNGITDPTVVPIGRKITLPAEDVLRKLSR